jgi:hypothetical protein
MSESRPEHALDVADDRHAAALAQVERRLAEDLGHRGVGRTEGAREHRRLVGRRVRFAWGHGDVGQAVVAVDELHAHAARAALAQGPVDASLDDLGSWSGTSRQLIFANALLGITVLLPSPW